MTVGVWANLGTDVAGDTGSASITDCSYAGGSVDTVPYIEDLEASGGRDRLVGDNSATLTNNLLGRSGVDSLYGADGSDSMQTNAADDDSTIDCGLGLDSLIRDLTFPGDTTIDRNTTDCDAAQGGIQDKAAVYGGPTAIDIDAIQNHLGFSDPPATPPLVFFRLGDKTGTTAFAYPPTVNDPSNGSYVGGVQLNATTAEGAAGVGRRGCPDRRGTSTAILS